MYSGGALLANAAHVGTDSLESIEIVGLVEGLSSVAHLSFGE